MKKKLALILSIVLVLAAVVCVFSFSTTATDEDDAVAAGSITFTANNSTEIVIFDENAEDDVSTTYPVGSGSISYNAKDQSVILNAVEGNKIDFNISSDFTVCVQGENTINGMVNSTVSGVTMTLTGDSGGKMTATSSGSTVSSQGSLKVIGGEWIVSGGAATVVAQQDVTISGGTVSATAAGPAIVAASLKVSGNGGLAVYQTETDSSGAITLSSPGNVTVADNGKIFIYHNSSYGILFPSESGSALQVSGGQLEIYSDGETGNPFGGTASVALTGGVVLAHDNGTADFTLLNGVGATVQNHVFSGQSGSDWVYWATEAEYQYYNPLNVGNGVVSSFNGTDRWTFRAPIAFTEENQIQYKINGAVYSMSEDQTFFYPNNPVIRLIKDQKIYTGVDIQWGTMTFFYTVDNWDSETHTYKESKWVLQDGSSEATVEVANRGNTKISVSLTYKPHTGYESLVPSIQVDGTSAPKQVILNTTDDSLSYTVSLSGDKPAAEMDGEVVIGTLSLSFKSIASYNTNISHQFLATNVHKSGVQIYDLDQCNGDFSKLFTDDCVVWEWYENGLGDITAAKLRTTDLWGKVVICCNSGGKVRIIDYNTKEPLFQDSITVDTQNEGGPHDVEMLPNGDLIVAVTDGRLLYYALSANKEITEPTMTLNLEETVSRDGHGVCWDPRNECLWVLQDQWISKIVIENYGTADARLAYAKDTEGNYVGCYYGDKDLYGHAFTPLFGQPGKYLFSGAKSVWIFDSDTLTYEKADAMYQCGAMGKNCGVFATGNGEVKGITCFEDGTAVLLPANYNSASATYRVGGFHVAYWEDGIGKHSKVPAAIEGGYSVDAFYKVFTATTDYQ